MRNYAEAEEIRLIFSGSNFFETVDRIIDEAREVIHLQTYIFDCDETGMRVVEGLRNAAIRVPGPALVQRV